MYFDFEDGHPDLARVPSALTAREGVLLSIIVHLAIALVAVLLPETDWWKARLAERQAELERIQAAVVEKQRDQPRFVFMQPQVELAPRTPPRPDAPNSDLDRTAVTRERAPVPANPQPFSRGNTPEHVEASPPPAPPQMARNQGPLTPPAPPAPQNQPRATNPGETPDATRLPSGETALAYRKEAESGRAAATSPLSQALRNLSRYAEQAAYREPQWRRNQPPRWDPVRFQGRRVRAVDSPLYRPGQAQLVRAVRRHVAQGARRHHVQRAQERRAHRPHRDRPIVGGLVQQRRLQRPGDQQSHRATAD